MRSSIRPVCAALVSIPLRACEAIACDCSPNNALARLLLASRWPQWNSRTDALSPYRAMMPRQLPRFDPSRFPLLPLSQFNLRNSCSLMFYVCASMKLTIVFVGWYRWFLVFWHSRLLWPVNLSLGQQCPCNPRCLVGHRHQNHIGGAAG